MSETEQYFVNVRIPYRGIVKYRSEEELLRNDEKIQDVIKFLHEDNSEPYSQRDIIMGADISRSTLKHEKKMLNGNSRLELLLENEVLDEKDTFDCHRYVRGESWDKYLER